MSVNFSPGETIKIGEVRISACNKQINGQVMMDEIFHPSFHLERMDDHLIWMRIYQPGGDDIVLWFNSQLVRNTHNAHENNDEPILNFIVETDPHDYDEE